MNKRKSKTITDEDFQKMAERARLQGRKGVTSTPPAPEKGSVTAEAEDQAQTISAEVPAEPQVEAVIPEKKGAPDAEPQVEAAVTQKEEAPTPDPLPAPIELRPQPSSDGVVRITTGVRAGSRPSGLAFRQDNDLIPRTLNLAAPLMELVTQWVREQRSVDRKVSASWLFRAALHDFPTDLGEVERLAQLVPEEVYRDRPTRIGVVVTADILTRLEDAQFELSATRSRATRLWHCVSAAVARQLESEGIRLVLQDV